MQEDDPDQAKIREFGLTYGEGEFLNMRFAAVKPRKVAVIGFNPGMGGKQKIESIGSNNAIASPGLNRSEKSWRTKCASLARAKPHQVVLLELISTPSATQAQLANWQFEMEKDQAVNLKKIEHHEPDIIFQTGVGSHHTDMVRSLFNLFPDEPFTHVVNGRVVFKRFNLRLTSTNKVIPWLAVRHISQNLSRNDRNIIHAYVDKELNGAGVTK